MSKAAPAIPDIGVSRGLQRLPNRAHATADGIAKSVGITWERHPTYGTPSFALHAYLPLEEGMAVPFDEIKRHKTGKVRFSVRSALAQLGVDAFDPDTTEMVRRGNLVQVDTLITSFNGERGERVIDVLREETQEGRRPHIARTVFLPDVARLSRDEVMAAREAGALQMEEGADFYSDGSIGLPLQPVLYDFTEQAWSRAAIAAIINGAGRATLATMREEYPELPDTLEPRDFLVTGVQVNTTRNHVVLRRETVTKSGRKTPVIHGESCLLEAGRTVDGTRQFELWNANGAAQPVHPLRVVADLYRASKIANPGH